MRFFGALLLLLSAVHVNGGCVGVLAADTDTDSSFLCCLEIIMTAACIMCVVLVLYLTFLLF